MAVMTTEPRTPVERRGRYPPDYASRHSHSSNLFTPTPVEMPSNCLPAVRDSQARIRVPTNSEMDQDFQTSTACPADVT